MIGGILTFFSRKQLRFFKRNSIQMTPDDEMTHLERRNQNANAGFDS